MGTVGDEISSSSALALVVSGWGSGVDQTAIARLRESVEECVRPGIHVIRLKWDLDGRKVVSYALADEESIIYDNVATHCLRSCGHHAPELVMHSDAGKTNARFHAADTLFSILGYPVASYHVYFFCNFDVDGVVCGRDSKAVVFNAPGWNTNAEVCALSGDIGVSNFQEIAWNWSHVSPLSSTGGRNSCVIRADSQSGALAAASEYCSTFVDELYDGRRPSILEWYYDYGALLMLMLLLVLDLLVIRVVYVRDVPRKLFWIAEILLFPVVGIAVFYVATGSGPLRITPHGDSGSFKQEKRELQNLLDSDEMHDPHVHDAILKRVMILDEIILANSLDDYQRQQDAYDKAMALAEDRDAFLTSIATCLSVSRPGFVKLLRDKGLTDWEIGYCGLYLYGLSSSDVGHFIRSKIYYRYNSSIRSKLGLSSRDTNLNLYLRELADEDS